MWLVNSILLKCVMCEKRCWNVVNWLKNGCVCDGMGVDVVKGVVEVVGGVGVGVVELVGGVW